MKLITQHEVPRDAFDDMPDAPVAGTTTAENVPVDSSGDASMFEGVPTMGEPIPIGTYHFRLDRYTSGLGKIVDKAGNARVFGDGTPIPDQPWYQLFWTVQQEPHTGRVLTDFCPWVSKEVRTKAQGGDAVARELLKDRLWKVKALLEAAGFTPAESFDLEKDFFALNLELRIQVGLQQGKSKDATGKYVPDGSMRNKVMKFMAVGAR